MQPGSENANGPANASWWHDAKRIFAAALELPVTERRAYAAKACGSNADLYREVSSLLENSEGTETFFERPPAGRIAAPAGRMVGRRIGPYKILRKIGAGGMGAVYLAERADDQFRKLVALKAVRPDLMDDHALRRFQNERQALAVLDHPNIIKLLDGGTTEEGEPYLVTEYIDGQAIDSYCESRKLPIGERLKLFRIVLAAVHYAHQNLVVHRDLKPSNILVAMDGTPKLLDFGIAKLLRPEFAVHMGLTHTRMQPMTPEFASPEQITGQPITTASDIYSLGVILYRLLTGRDPYDLKTPTVQELARAICETEPERPSKFAARQNAARRDEARLLRGDLDTIVLMAMRKEPQRRYASAQHFSEDLRRYLEGWPVEARKAGVWYKASKFVGRHRAATAGAAVLSLGLIVSGTAALREKMAAERRFEDLRHFANSVLTDFDDALREGATQYRQTLVTEGTGYLDSLAKEEHSPQIRHDLVNGYIKMGDVQGNLYGQNLGRTALSEASYRKALAIALEELRSAPANRDYQVDAFRAHMKLGEVLNTSGNGAEALKHYEAALRVNSGIQPVGTTDVDSIIRMRTFWMAMGSHRAVAFDSEGALESYQHAIETSERLPNPFLYNGKERNKAPLVAEARELAAISAAESGDTGGAEDAIRESISAYQGAIEANPKSGYRRVRAKAYKNLAEVQSLMGKQADALVSMRASLGMSEALLAEDPTSEQSQLDVQQALMQEIPLLAANGLAQEAEAQTRRALRLMKSLADAPAATYQPASDYAELLATTPFAGMRDDAAALEYAQKANVLTHGSDPNVLKVVALAYDRNGDRQHAREAVQKALSLLPPAKPGHTKTPLRSELESLQGRL